MGTSFSLKRTAAARLQAVASVQETAHKGTASSTALFGSLMVELEKTAAPDKMARVNGLTIRPAKVTKS